MGLLAAQTGRPTCSITWMRVLDTHKSVLFAKQRRTNKKVFASKDMCLRTRIECDPEGGMYTALGYHYIKLTTKVFFVGRASETKCARRVPWSLKASPCTILDHMICATCSHSTICRIFTICVGGCKFGVWIFGGPHANRLGCQNRSLREPDLVVNQRLTWVYGWLTGLFLYDVHHKGVCRLWCQLFSSS